MADNNFDKLAKKAQDITLLIDRMPRIIGTEAVNFSKRSFRQQAWQDMSKQPWAKRKPGAPRNKGRALLVDSGQLRNSPRIFRVTKNSVVYGSSDKKAKIHNEGGTILIPVTAKMRGWAFGMAKKTKQSKFLGIALTKKTVLTVKMPKRQFMGKSAALRKLTKNMMIKRFNLILN